MTEIDQIILDQLKELREEMRSLRTAYDSNRDRDSARMSKLEVEQGKQKVRTGLIGAIAGILTGAATRLF